MTSLILRATTPILMLLMMVVSIYALLRGHHESGGGFIGGLLAAAAFSLHALAYDVKSTRRLLGVEPQVMIGTGLLMAVGAGITGLLSGGSFLQGQWLMVNFPGVGEIHVGTSLIFDIGVYVVVTGVVLMIILTTAEE